MWKMTGWLGKTIAAGLIVSFLSIWTTGYIVNSYVETLLKQYNLPIEVQPMALSGVWGKLWGAKAVTEEVKKPANAEEVNSGSNGQGTEEPPVAIDAFEEQAEPPLTDIGVGSGIKADGGAIAESGEEDTQIEEGQVPAIDGTETAITTDDLNEVKEQMSDADKELLFGLLMSKLPQESWQTISAFMENGLTDEELTSVQQIMAQHLDKEQYEQMMEILKKY